MSLRTTSVATLWNEVTRNARGRQDLAVTRRRRHGRATPAMDRLEERSLLSIGLDPTFGSAGGVSLGYPLSEIRGADVSVFQVALQTDGKILAVGTVSQSTSSTSTDDLIAVRLNPDGSLDPTFGTAGRAIVPITIGTVRVRAMDAGVVLQSDGKIVLGGEINYVVGDTAPPNRSDLVAVRLNANGTVDTAFGGGGNGARVVDFGASDDFAGIGLTSTGKIVLAGDSILPLPTEPPPGFVNTGRDFVLAQINPDGSLDLGFDGDGRMVIDFNSTLAQLATDDASGVVVQPDGKIVIAGTREIFESTAIPPTTNADFAIARVNINGTLDTAFGTGGKQLVAFNLGGTNRDTLSGLALQADGKILVIGTANVQRRLFDAMFEVTQAEIDNLAMARLTTAGVLDTTFDTDGKVTLPISTMGVASSTEGLSVIELTDGKILVGGTVSNAAMFGEGFLAQFKTDGSRDLDYGLARIPFVAPNTLVVQPDGKVLIAAGRIVRTTAPEPKVTEAVLTPIGRGRNIRFNGIQVRFNTRVNQILAARKGTFQVRLGTRGRNFVTVRRVTLDADGQGARLILARPVSLTARQVLQVLISGAGIVGADSQVLNKGNDLAVSATRPLVI